MARISYTARALNDLERLAAFLRVEDQIAAENTIGLIVEAVQTLKNHPLMGRPVERGFRELVISRGRSGYLALYEFEDVHDSILILAIRLQREAGFMDR